MEERKEEFLSSMVSRGEAGECLCKGRLAFRFGQSILSLLCLETEGLGRVRGVVGMCDWKQSSTSSVPVGGRLLVGGLCPPATAVMV